MDFAFKEEQQQFADALRRWVDKDYSFEARKRIIHSESGVSDEAWATLVELGMLALPVPEEQGGFNGSAADMMVVMQELGRGLVVEPYFATVLGVQFLKLAGGQEGLLERVAAGELKLACALGEQQSRHALNDVLATDNAGAGRLSGRKTVVLHGGQAGRTSSRHAATAPSAIPAAFRCMWCRVTPWACRSRTIEPLTASVPQRLNSTTSRARCSANRARAGRYWKQQAIMAQRCCARKPSAPWMPFSPPRSNT